jgi:GntR family transcriptional regulator
MMLIRVDPDSARPLYDQVAASVRADILSGALSPGDRLPPARDVAGALEINQHTVLHAYQRLREEGLVDLRRGRGAVIAAGAAPLAELARDIDELVGRAAALGVSTRTLAGIVQSHRELRPDSRTLEGPEEVSP